MANYWQPGAQVNNAWNNYANTIGQKPGGYNSTWQSQLDSLYGQISGRKPFQFDMNGDALYQQYKDSFTMQAQQATQDAMGMAAARTGGFNSSVAQTAAHGAYQGYMNQLAQTVPGLENQAYGRYMDRGQGLLDLYGITQQNEMDAYGRYRDSVGDWQAERDFNYGLYSDERGFDYGQWGDARNYDYQKATDTRNFNYQKTIDDRDFKYRKMQDDRLYKLQK